MKALSIKAKTLSCIAALLSALAASPAMAEDYDFTIAASHPPMVSWVRELKDFVVPQSIARAKELGHTITWTEAYSGVLFNFHEAVEGLGDGLAELAWVGTLWEPNTMPLTNVSFYAPFGTGDPQILNEIQDELHETLPALTKEWHSNNIVYLGQQVIDEYVIITKKPIASLADLSGLKLMAPGAVALWLSGSGAVGVGGGLPSYYNNISAGVADGALVPGSTVLLLKLHEVAPYITKVNLGGCICGGLAMNMDTWKLLPDELQTMFRGLGRQYGKRVAETITAQRAKHFTILAKEGAVFSTLPEAEQQRWAQGMPNIAKRWADDLEKRGLPARRVLSAYMTSQRKRGVVPLRDWGKEL